jgi:tripartite-type tricarboxylate transporter receptor subunit TctC
MRCHAGTVLTFGGHVALMFPAPALPLIRAGKVRALGVTSAVPLPSAPDIPPLAEVGVPGFDIAGWGMIVAPARTPAPIVTRLYDAFRAVESRPDVRDRLILLGLAPQTSPRPETLQAFINDEMLRWGKAVTAAGIAASE